MFESITIFVAKRSAATSDFETPVPLGLGPRTMEPEISDDGLELYYFRWDNERINRVSRTSLSEEFSTQVSERLEFHSTGPQQGPTLSADGFTLYYGHVAPDWSSSELTRVHRQTVNQPFMVPGEAIPVVNTSGADNNWPSISSDSLELFFQSNRNGKNEIFVARRTTSSANFSEPISLGLSVGGSVGDPEISSDGKTLYFSADVAGDWGLWTVTRTCSKYN